MDVLELIKALAFGVLEGITEWLPISSTGHLLLFERVVTLVVSPECWHLFLVVIQLGAVLAVVATFCTRVREFGRESETGHARAVAGLFAKVIVACIPAAVIGIPLDDLIESVLGGPFVIAGALIVYGIAFVVIERVRAARARRVLSDTSLQMAGHAPKHFAVPVAAQESAAESADSLARVQRLEDLDWKTAFGIGLFQVLSLVPGTSRSGATIIGGLLLGCSRVVAAEFTFFMAVPVMAGASLLRCVKFFLKGSTLTSQEVVILIVACVSALVVSLITIRLLLGFVRRHSFAVFGWYRIVLGVIVIATTLLW